MFKIIIFKSESSVIMYMSKKIIIYISVCSFSYNDWVDSINFKNDNANILEFVLCNFWSLCFPEDKNVSTCIILCHSFMIPMLFMKYSKYIIVSFTNIKDNK